MSTPRFDKLSSTHWAFDTGHSSTIRHNPTGIIYETWTPKTRTGKFGKPQGYFYHEQTPKPVTHPSFAAALKDAVERGLVRPSIGRRYAEEADPGE